MPSISVHTSTVLFSMFLFAAAMPAQASDVPASTAGVSKIRIVRLSEVKGAVQMDRNNGRGFEPAMANMPVVEKSKLRTEQGVAEVEFEDNSTLRLAPNSEVEFPQLERMATGATASSVQVLKGTVYASMVKTKGNEFNLLFGTQKLALPALAHVRLDMTDKLANLAVLDGSVQVADAKGEQDIPKKKTVTFQLQDQNAPEVAKDVAQAPFDSWDKQSAEYHARSAYYSSLSSSPYAYGVNDMMYYGSFMDASSSCGSMWRPYFASAAWDPYSNGAWAYYSGAGYSWVSPYPWGWTPYHYGSWSFCPGTGWGWMPGGSWNGLNNIAMMMNPMTPTTATGSGGIGARPIPPGQPPRAGESTIIGVNKAPLVRSGIASGDTFLFRRDSAGMGIPRETLGKLDKLSRQADEKGFAHAPIYISAPAPVANGARPSNTMAPQTLHRGYAPGYEGEAQSSMSNRPAEYSGATRASSPMSAPSAPAAPSGGPTSSGGRPR